MSSEQMEQLAAQADEIQRLDLAQQDKIALLINRLQIFAKHWADSTSAIAGQHHKIAQYRIENNTREVDPKLIEDLSKAFAIRGQVLFQGKDAIFDCANSLKQLQKKVRSIREANKVTERPLPVEHPGVPQEVPLN